MLKRLILTLALLGWVAAPGLRASEAPAAGAAGAVEAAHAAAADATHGDAAHGEAHAEGAGEGHEYPLLPTASKSDALQALWVLIIFLALLAILCWKVFPNVLAGLKAREQRIRADIAEAEAARKRAAETLEQYNKQLATAEQQVRDILAKAAADAEKIATSLKMQAQQEAEEIKERASKDIDAARKQALADIYAQAAELSTNIASKILRRNLNPDDQRDLVNSSLEQLQTVGGKV